MPAAKGALVMRKRRPTNYSASLELPSPPRDPDAMDLVEGLENENRKLRALNAELLVALKDLSEKSPCPDKYDPRWIKAEAAIAKAEGK